MAHAGVEVIEGFRGGDVKTMPLGKLDQQRKMDQGDLRAIKQDLEKEQKVILERQHKLNECNRIFFEKKTKLNELRAQQDATLSSTDRKLIQRLSDRMGDTFFQPRPASDEDTIIVDVHYLPSMEVSAQGRVSGEGGGSRDAKFPVKLTENVSSLTKSAATYWGLEPDKVFFMDREGRIVFEDTSLAEVVLPPVHQSHLASSSGASRRLSTISTVSSKDAADGALVPAGDEPRQWTVRGRNYSLTLVRAMRPGEMPTREQLNKPEGEEWQDFTFDESRLAQDLKETIQKYGDPEYSVDKINMDGIPSLFDLIQAGKDNKKMKRADTMCRAVELAVFMLCFILAYSIIFASNLRRPLNFRQVLSLFEQRLMDFNGDEADALSIESFHNISTHRQYYAWLHGPLQRTVVKPSMSRNNLFVLGVHGWRYDGKDPVVEPLVGWCIPPDDPDEEENVTDNESLASIDMEGVTESPSNVTEGTTATGTTVTMTVTTATTTRAPFLPEGCAPLSLKSCPSRRVVETYARGVREGDVVPPCRQRYADTLIYTLLDSYTGVDEFSFIRGEVGHYFGGYRTNVLLSNDKTFNSSVETMEIERLDVDFPAWSFVVFAFSPTLQGVIIAKLLFEKSMTGTVITSFKESTIDLGQNSESGPVFWSMALLLAVCIFAMELRRILGCPKRCTFEHERDRCSSWTCVFLLLPVVMLVALVLLSWRLELSASREALQIDSQTGVLDDEATQYLFQLSLLDQYIWGMYYATLVILNALLFRYSLMYFPQLAYTSAMVAKVFWPLFYTLLFIMMALVVLAFFLYMMFSSEAARFRSLMHSILVCITFLQRGGLGDWYKLYSYFPFLFVLSLLYGFFVFHFIFAYFPASVLLSHWKEKELRENVSYHRFWLMEINKKKSSSKKEDHGRIKSLFASAQEFNPATRKVGGS